jgi:hypothetical protein
LHTPTFPPFPLLSLNNGTVTDYNGIFSAVREMMFTFVEIENALQMEFYLSELHVAGPVEASTVTPMKIQMIFQAHRRFVLTHVLGSIVNCVHKTEMFRQSLRYPNSSTFTFGSEDDSDFFQTGNPAPLPILNLRQNDGFNEMVGTCDLLVKSSHQVKGGKGDELLGFLSNCRYAITRLDLELIGCFKNTTAMLITYFEDRDSQELSLVNLYHEIGRALDIIRFDLMNYVSRWSTEVVVKYLRDFMGVDGFNCEEKDVLMSNGRERAGWQVKDYSPV